MISSIQLSEFRQEADYIARFPPLAAIAARIANFPPFNKSATPEILLSKKVVELTQTSWYWVGQSLSAFFEDKPDPLSSPEAVEQITQQLNNIFFNLTPEEIERKIETLKIQSSKYRILASLIFEAEKFIRDEAEKLSFPIPNRRSEILRWLAFEECLWNIMGWLYDWEAPSRAQINEQFRDWQHYQEGEIDKVTILQRSKRWDKQEAKLLNTLPEYHHVCPMTFFCNLIFERHKRSLPSHAAFIAWYKFLPSAQYAKFGIFGGEYKEHFRQTKGKGKPKTS